LTVAVVGAGLSGLATAYRLVRADVDVIVLEARERVGGRAWRIPVGDTTFEAGCEALDHEHHALRRLAGDVGTEVVEAPPWGAKDPPELDGEDLALFGEFEAEIERLASRVDPAHPEDLEDARRLDAQTLSGWLVEHGASQRLLDAVEALIAIGSSTVPTTEMSLLGYAAKLAAGAAPTGLRLRFVGGPSALAARLARELEGRVTLGAAVAACEQGDHGVVVRLEDGRVTEADRAVVAVPLTLQRTLDFDPPLPEARRRALREGRYGDAVKEAALFADKPNVAPAATPEGAMYPSDENPRVVIRFAGAEAAARPADFSHLVGARPRAVAGVRWSRERWTGGTYLILGPGHLTTWWRQLAEPHGRIHFAGAERSNLPSYMEGAVRAGEEAAAEVLHAT
jgi:monoamine oxidase